MHVKREQSVKLVLTLEEDEAKWLHGWMQNAFATIDKESPQDKEMRERFFNATDLNII